MQDLPRLTASLAYGLAAGFVASILLYLVLSVVTKGQTSFRSALLAGLVPTCLVAWWAYSSPDQVDPMLRSLANGISDVVVRFLSDTLGFWRLQGPLR